MGPVNPEGTLSGGCLKIGTSVREEGSSRHCETGRNSCGLQEGLCNRPGQLEYLVGALPENTLGTERIAVKVGEDSK